MGKTRRRGGRWTQTRTLPVRAILAAACGLATSGVPAAAAMPAAEPPPAAHPLLKFCETEPTPACGAALEARALREHPEAARRDGAVLLVNTPSGEPLRLEDRPDTVPEGALQHFYLGPLAGTESLLVQLWSPGQPARYLLLSGGMTALALEAPPWPAPSGRLLVTVAPATAGETGGVSLFNLAGNQWRRLYRFEPAAGLGFTFHGWRADSAALRLDWAWRAGLCGEHAAASGSTQLRDGPYGWDLFPALPTRCP
jgi:hypothetical protein